MTSLFLISVISATAFSLLFADSIIAFGAFSLTAVFCMSALVGFTLSSWAGMVVLLVYVGGLIVIFAYFLAICPDQVITFNEMVGSFLTFLAFATFSSLISSHLAPNWSSNVMPIMTIYSVFNFPLLILIALILFLTLVSVVNIVQLKQGPLRPFTSNSRSIS